MAAQPIQPNLRFEPLPEVEVRLANTGEEKRFSGAASTSLLRDEGNLKKALSSFPVQALVQAVLVSDDPTRWLREHVIDEAVPAIRPCMSRRPGAAGYAVHLFDNKGDSLSIIRKDFQDAVNLYEAAMDVCLSLREEHGRDFIETTEGRRVAQSFWYTQAVPNCEDKEAVPKRQLRKREDWLGAARRGEGCAARSHHCIAETATHASDKTFEVIEMVGQWCCARHKQYLVCKQPALANTAKSP
jgi:hypothetical protein